MAAVGQRNDKKLTKLKQESKKLHAEVEALEDALMLHQRYQYDNDTSVRGILRKEIGGSIWQRGGSGKLHSYRSANDLDEANNTNVVPRINKRRQRRNKHTEAKENELSRDSNQDLVAKVVAIAAKDHIVSSGAESKDQNFNKVITAVNQTQNMSDKAVTTGNQRQSMSGSNSDLIVNSNSHKDSDQLSVLKSKVIEKASMGVIHRKSAKSQSDASKIAQAESTKILVNLKNESSKDQSPSNTNNAEQTSKIKSTVSTNDKTNDVTDKLPSNDVTGKPPSNKMKQTNIKPSQALERSRDIEVLKILSMSSNQRQSEPMAKSGVEISQSKSGVEMSQNKSVNSTVEDGVSKCDPSVQNWIKGLGLLEEDKYLRLFAENEIDMDELSQLTALQLNEMGITAFGALNKILRGIKELKQNTRSEMMKSADLSSTKKLLSSHDHQKVLNNNNPTGHTKNPEVHRSQTHEEPSNESRTNLRRSRSFVHSSAVTKSFDKVPLYDGSYSRLQNELNIELPKSSNIIKSPDSVLHNSNECLVVQETVNKKMSTFPKEEKIKTLRKRSNSPARRPASSPARRRNTVSEKQVDSDVPLKKQSETTGQKSSLSRQASESSSNGKKRQGSGKSKNVPVLWPKAKSHSAEKKAKEGVTAAAKKFNERQKEIIDKEEKHTKAKKAKKAQRDEMAARHEQRQQNDTEKDYEMDEGRIDLLGKEYEKERFEISELDKDISKLISVTVLDNTNKADDELLDLKQKEEKPQRSRTRSSRHMRQSISNPVLIGADLPDNLMSGVHHRHSTRQSEVRSIESQIEALQSKALSGEMVTMDLVKVLQQRLEEIEQQIRDTKHPKAKTKFRHEPRVPVSASVRENETEQDNRPARSPDLSRISPLKSMEIDRDDIMFDETDLIGQGTFSKVYHGVCMGTEVAIKQLRIPLTSHDTHYFAAEVSLLKELHHPRVVLLLGVCTSDKLPVMVLEFMANGSLYHHLHDPKMESMDHAEYYRVAHDIALGMNYLHQHKPQVLHLDLKSMNVLLDANGRAKIADFGFSKFRHDADIKASKTSKKKGMCGSPTWMAPELLETGEITTKADVYSFGIILWEMLTRSHPYEGCSVFQILERVRLNKRPEIPPGSPPELSAFIQRCWDQNIAKRPPFKDIILQLDKLAFPPDWRALFKEAGVPNQALEDVQSARTIISLVNNTLDLENVKTMMEDIRHSNDAIKASHDLTRDGTVRQSHDSIGSSQNFLVQSREPQKHMTYSIKKSYDKVSTPKKQSFVQTRHSEESLFTKKSYDSPFSSKSKKFDEEPTVRNSIEEEIAEHDNVGDSFDFKFNTKFDDSDEHNLNERKSDKLLKNSKTKIEYSMKGEDTTAEYLEYLRTSCEILSPSQKSMTSSKPSEQVKQFLLLDSPKSDNSGSVIETVATIPITPKIDLRKSTQDINKNVSLSARNSMDNTQNDMPVRMSHDLPLRMSHDMPLRMSHEHAMQETVKSKADIKTATQTAISVTSISESQKVSSPNKHTHENKILEIHSSEESLKTDSPLRRSLPEKKSHESLMQEVRNSLTRPRKKGDEFNQISKSVESNSNLRKLAKEEQSPPSFVREERSLPSFAKEEKSMPLFAKKDNSTNEPGNGLQNKTMKEDNNKIGPQKRSDQGDIEKKIDGKSDKDVTVCASFTENLLQEMKHLHSKLRNEKNEHVEEIKNLHSKLRSEKVENTEKTAQNSVEKNVNKEFTENGDKVVVNKKDSEEFNEVIDDIDNLSVDSLDLNDSISDIVGHVTESSQHTDDLRIEKKMIPLAQSSDKNTAKNTNQSSNSVPADPVMRGQSLPDLRTSLNLEIAQKYSSIKQMKKDNVKRKKCKEPVQNEQLGSTKEIIQDSKTKPIKKLNTSGNTMSTASETNSEHSRKSIEAWVEQKAETNPPKPMQRKKSTSNHPPPIVIPDEPPIPLAPPIQTNSPTNQIIPPPPPPPLPEVQMEDTNKLLKLNKEAMPKAKLSSQEAQVSNTTKLSKGENSGQLMVQSTELREQREVLQSISKPHPNQLQDLSHVNKQTYTSIAEILKRAVFNRREAMGEDNFSPSPSVASSWSFVDD